MAVVDRAREDLEPHGPACLGDVKDHRHWPPHHAVRPDAHYARVCPSERFACTARWKEPLLLLLLLARHVPCAVKVAHTVDKHNHENDGHEEHAPNDRPHGDLVAGAADKREADRVRRRHLFARKDRHVERDPGTWTTEPSK